MVHTGAALDFDGLLGAAHARFRWAQYSSFGERLPTVNPKTHSALKMSRGCQILAFSSLQHIRSSNKE